jgi:hypothetical protein
MPVIFISYRREDSAGHAGRLFDRLREHFGRDRVFLDVVGIDAGVDFVETLDKAVGSCDVLLAVIGREWLTCCDKQGRRRLDDPNDFIRAEISAALNRNVRVVPVLVEGAEMPPTDALPEELKRLTRRQAVELRDSRWDSDVEALISALEREASSAPRPAPAAPVRVEKDEKQRKPGRPALLWGIGVLLAALIAGGLYLSFSGPEPTSGPISGPTSEPTSGPGSVPGKETVQPVEPPVEPSPEPGQTTAPEPEPPRTVSTPNLVGLTLDQALEKLKAAGLKAGDLERRQTAEAPARQVLSQFPRAGKEIDLDSPVDLVYAEAPPDTRIEVPDVVGTQVQQAMETIQRAGLRFTRRSEQSSQAEFQVLRQEPEAGSRVEQGTQVTLFYAVPIKDSAPPAQTSVVIYYANEADQKTAEGLVSYLGSLSLRGISYKILQSRRLEAGKLYYSSEADARLANSIAGRSGTWLSDLYHQPVRIEVEQNSRIARSGLILALPSSQGGSSRRPN